MSSSRPMCAVLCALLVAWAVPAAAQLSWGGSPPSQRLTLPGVVPTAHMEAVDVAAYLAEDAQADKATPFRFGATLPVDLGLESGLWSTAPNGDRVWRLR